MVLCRLDQITKPHITRQLRHQAHYSDGRPGSALKPAALFFLVLSQIVQHVESSNQNQIVWTGPPISKLELTFVHIVHFLSHCDLLLFQFCHLLFIVVHADLWPFYSCFNHFASVTCWTCSEDCESWAGGLPTGRRSNYTGDLPAKQNLFYSVAQCMFSLQNRDFPSILHRFPKAIVIFRL